jgi:hypothetical protein
VAIAAGLDWDSVERDESIGVRMQSATLLGAPCCRSARRRPLRRAPRDRGKMARFRRFSRCGTPGRGKNFV